MIVSFVIYDQTGFIYHREDISTDNFKAPIGVPYLMIKVPLGKYLEKIDLSGGRPQPVFVDIPKSAYQLILEDNKALQTQLEKMTEVIDALLTMNI